MIFHRTAALFVAFILAACGSSSIDQLWVLVDIPAWPQKVFRIRANTTLARRPGFVIEVQQGTPGFAFTIPADQSGDLDITATGLTTLDCPVSSAHVRRSISASTQFPITEALRLSPTYPLEQKPSSPQSKLRCSAWVSLSPARTDLVTIYDIWGSDDTHIWLAGNVRRTQTDTPIGILYYWNGKSLTEALRLPDTFAIYSLLGVQSDQILMATDLGIMRWDGQAALLTLSPSNRIISIWGKDKNIYWAATPNNVYFWNGTAWKNHNLPEFTKIYTSHIRKIWGYDPDNIWLISNSYQTFHWNGTVWESQCGGAYGAAAMWGTAGGPLWQAGSIGFSQWDGVSWAAKGSVAGFTPTAMIGFDDNNLIAVGFDNWSPSSGVVMGKTVIWDGSAWRDTFLNTESGLMAIWASDPDHIYAADAKARLLRCVAISQ